MSDKTSMRTRAAMLMLLLGAAQTATAGDKSPTCSNKTLKGTYSFTMTGAVAAGAGFAPEAYVGFATYDGLGNMRVQKTSNVGGVWNTQISTGFYEVSRGCTAVGTFPAAKHVYYIAPDGSRFDYVKIADFVGDQYVPTADRLASTATRVSQKVSNFPVN